MVPADPAMRRTATRASVKTLFFTLLLLAGAIGGL